MSENPIADFIARVAARGYKGVSLFVRAGASLDPIDEYVIEAGCADRIYEDAKQNAEGFENLFSAFVVRAEGGPGQSVSRSFSVQRSAPLSGGERYETTDKATMRLLLEQVDRSHKTIVAMATHQSAMVQSLAAPVQQMADSLSESIQELRANRVQVAREERETIEVTAREERRDRLLEQLLQYAPVVVQQLAAGGGGEPKA